MLSLNHRDIISIDVETSGINPFRHEILAVGLSPLDPTLPKRTIYIRHENIKWGDFARENFRNFSAEWEKQSVDPTLACHELETYLNETFQGRIATAVGHNIGFDVAFMRRLAYQGGIEQFAGLSHRVLDTHTLLYLLNLQHKIPKSAVNSDGAFAHFQIHIEDSVRHTALADAQATGELLKRIFSEFSK